MKKFIQLSLLLLLTLSLGCKEGVKDDPGITVAETTATVTTSDDDDPTTTPASTTKEITAFSFTTVNNSNLSADVTAVISGTNITATVNNTAPITALVPTFTTTGSSVAVSSAAQTSGETANDFSSAVTYTVTAEDRSTQDYTVTVTQSAAIWAQEAYIKANNAESSEVFGSVLSLSSDTLAVGVYDEDNGATTITNGPDTIIDTGAASAAGAVYIYKRTGSIWAQEAYIKASNAQAFDYFGRSVSLTLDTLAVGANEEDNGATTITNGPGTIIDTGFASASGAVYIYKRTGTTWAQEAYIKANNSQTSDFFGFAVTLSSDTLAVGAYQEDNGATTITNGPDTIVDSGAASASGAVYVYKRTGTTWAQEAYIKANNAQRLDYFGKSVSLSSDTLAVGAEKEDNGVTTITNGTGTIVDTGAASASGAVYVYKRTGTTWAQEAYIKANNAGVKDYFGNVISLSSDTLATGAEGDDSSGTTITNGADVITGSGTVDSSGAAYVYKRTGSTWAQEAYIKANNAEAWDYFGVSVSLSSNTLAVGAKGESNGATTITNGPDTIIDTGAAAWSGAIYIYKRN